MFASRAKGIKSFNSSWVRWICVWPASRRKRWNLEELQSLCPPKPFSLGPLSSMGGKWTWISFPFYWRLNFWNCFERLGGRGGSLWPIRGNIRAHTSYRAQSTPSPYCCHLKVFYCWCKNRPKSNLSQKKRGTSWTFFFFRSCCIFQSLFFHFWQAAKPVIDICFDWQKYQNIKPSSFNNQAVSYVFGTVCKRIVQSLFRSKERKNKLNDRNKLLWGSDAYPIIQSKVLTKDETEEKKE